MTMLSEDSSESVELRLPILLEKKSGLAPSGVSPSAASSAGLLRKLINRRKFPCSRRWSKPAEKIAGSCMIFWFVLASIAVNKPAIRNEQIFALNREVQRPKAVQVLIRGVF